MTQRRAHYTVRVADQICEQIALGKTLNQALVKVGYLAPAINTIWKWLDIYPEFREKYERARQLQADMHADKMLELAEDVLDQPKAANAHRVAIDVLKWQAEIRNKQRYGRTKDDAGKNKPMDPNKLRAEIKRLETELGVAESKVQPIRVVK
jgi:terminase small subunit-like protein